MEEDDQTTHIQINDPEYDRLEYSRIEGRVRDRLIVTLPGSRAYRAYILKIRDDPVFQNGRCLRSLPRNLPQLQMGEPIHLRDVDPDRPAIRYVASELQYTTEPGAYPLTYICLNVLGSPLLFNREIVLR